MNFSIKAAKELVLGFGFDVALLAIGEILADAVLESRVVFVVAQLLGEVVIQLGQDALLDCLHLHFVGNGLAGKLLFGIVGRIDDLGLQFLAGLCSAQRVRECLDRGFAADLDERVLALNRLGRRLALGSSFDLALIADFGPVAIGKGAVFFNRFDRGARIAQVLELGAGTLLPLLRRRAWEPSRPCSRRSKTTAGTRRLPSHEAACRLRQSVQVGDRCVCLPVIQLVPAARARPPNTRTDDTVARDSLTVKSVAFQHLKCPLCP